MVSWKECIISFCRMEKCFLKRMHNILWKDYDNIVVVYENKNIRGHRLDMEELSILKEKIELMRSRLERAIEERESQARIYEYSVELDRLIERYLDMTVTN